MFEAIIKWEQPLALRNAANRAFWPLPYLCSSRLHGHVHCLLKIFSRACCVCCLHTRFARVAMGLLSQRDLLFGPIARALESEFSLLQPERFFEGRPETLLFLLPCGACMPGLRSEQSGRSCTMYRQTNRRQEHAPARLPRLQSVVVGRESLC